MGNYENRNKSKSLAFTLLIAGILLGGTLFTIIFSQNADAIMRYSKSFSILTKKTPNQAMIVDEMNDFGIIMSDFDSNQVSSSQFGTDAGTLEFSAIETQIGYVSFYDFASFNSSHPMSGVFRIQFQPHDASAYATVGFSQAGFNPIVGDALNNQTIYITMHNNGNYTLHVNNDTSSIDVDSNKLIDSKWHDLNIRLFGINSDGLGKVGFYLDGRRLGTISGYYPIDQVKPFVFMRHNSTDIVDPDSTTRIFIDRIAYQGYRDFTQDYIPDED